MSTLSLSPGTRLRTGGTTYEVTNEASIPAGVVPVVPAATRLLKVFCESCGYTARVTQRWIGKFGPPICPCPAGNVMTVAPPKAEAAEAAPVKVDAVKVKAPKKNAPKAAPAPAAPAEPDTDLEELLAEVEVDEPTATLDSTSVLSQLLAESEL